MQFFLITYKTAAKLCNTSDNNNKIILFRKNKCFDTPFTSMYNS